MQSLSEQVLERWSDKAAARDIARELNVATIRQIYKIVENAREMHDPRATYRAGRVSKDRPLLGTHYAGQSKKVKSRASGLPLSGWWFAATSVIVTKLGINSTDCARVEVSVSCLPTKSVQATVSRKSDSNSYSSFAEAFAAFPCEPVQNQL